MLKIFSYLHSRKKESDEWGFTSKDDASKSRLIQLVLTLSFIYLMVIIVFSVSGIQLTKAASATCLDIAGQGTQVLVGGVANSGIIDFDDPGIPYAQEACVEDPGADGVGPFIVKGWAWDTNLGWVSLYCQGGLNLGIGCGPNPYGVTINDSGELSGYAWGDGSGWISFDNGASSQVRVEVDDPECQGYIYGLVPPKAGCPVHGGGNQDTFAWSDNVKWIDLDGVIIPWFSLVQEVNPARVTVTLGPDPSVIRKANNNVPIARTPMPGLYMLRVEIRDSSGDPLDDSRYDFVIEPVWDKDTVKKDQTDESIQLDSLATPCTADVRRATNKPCSQADLGHLLNVSDWWYDIYSLAPTSNMNGITDPVTDAMEFPYESFISPVGYLPSLEENDLIFTGMEISVTDTDTNTCVFGDNAACATTEICADIGCNVSLKFRPRAEVTTLEQTNVAADKKDVLEMSVGIPEEFTFAVDQFNGAALLSIVNSVAAIDSSDPLVLNNLKFVNNDGGDGIYDFTDSWSSILTSDFTAAIAQQADSEVPTNFGGLYLYTTITDPGGVVKYFSNKLPREIGSSGIEPLAVLKGNVYTTGSSGITTAAEAIRSLGDVSTNILRDTIYKNVSSIVAGATEPTAGGSATLRGNSMSPGMLYEPLNTSYIIELMPDLVGPRVYYAKGSDIHIGQPGTTVPWTGNRTVIVVGGNVYIDENLYNGTNSNAKLGIIALKDLSSATPELEGHVYIHKDVSNIQANIFADGSVFSYDDVQGIPGADGEPQWGNLITAEQNLKYQQLLIEGSVASQNTVGGSGLIQAIKGDGTVAADVEQARLYDLNFLRYYTGLVRKETLDFNTNGILDVICQIGGVDQYISDESYKTRLVDGNGDPWPVSMGGCLWPPSYVDPLYSSATGLDEDTQLAATYINFDPPSADLPGFTVGSGVDVKVRPR